MLSRTYDACSTLAGVETDGGLMLLPLSHSTANAQIEMTVDMDGEPVRELTSIVEKNGKNEVTVIPVAGTREWKRQSASRRTVADWKNGQIRNTVIHG